MKVLLKQARIICPSSPHHGTTRDILVTDGIIEEIAENINAPADEIIAHDDLHVSTGWMDIFAHFGDPGEEHKETLETGTSAAAAGGFTDVLLIPDTKPSISSKSQVEYLLSKGKDLPVNIHPAGSITASLEGKQLSEMYDMQHSGAIAFTDGRKPVQSPGILLKALQYVLAMDKTIIQLPDDNSISAHGLMNEGVVSTRLGLPGKPAIAEELMIARDIELLKYSQSRLHITGISTKKGLELITQAKSEGLNITCSCTPHHLWFTDEDLSAYDTNLKVNPPVRTREDKEAILAGLKNGSIDAIASHHFPQHWDDKTCEFEYAKYGMTGLETLFSVLYSSGIALERIIELLTIAPRKIFGLQMPVLDQGNVACLSLFAPNATWIPDPANMKSRSKNTAFTGIELKGKPLGIVNKSKIRIN